MKINAMQRIKSVIFENLANFVTSIRLVLSAWLITLALDEGNRILMFWLAVFCILSDFVDGKTARYFNIISRTGSCLDRLADKVFVGPAVVILTWLYWPDGFSWKFRVFTSGLVLTIVLLEGILFLSGFYGLIKGLNLQSNRWGKLKMGFECSAVFLWLGALALEEYSGIDVFSKAIILVDVVLLGAVFLAVKSIEGYLEKWRLEVKINAS